jgi:hypothetical protein
MALAVRLSTLESWTGPLACDDVLRARFPDVDGATHPTLAAYLQTGDASHLGDPAGVCRVTVRPVDARESLQSEADACDGNPVDGLARMFARFEGIARRSLVSLSDLPDLKRGAAGYPIEKLGMVESYAALVAEVATHASRLGTLGKSHPPSCGGPSAPTSPGGTVAVSSSAPDVTGAAP